MGFIYKVTNKINGKIYIGKTLEKSALIRIKEHFNESKTNTKNRPFHNAIIKYGKENFDWEVLEEVELKKMNERERYWIEFYRSYVGFNDCNGYNATLGGEGTVKYDYDFIVKDYLKTKSKQKTAKNFNCCLQTVHKACFEKNVKTISNAHGVSVISIDESGRTKEYRSIRQAAEEIALINGKNPQTIRKRITSVIRHKPKQKAYGYSWVEKNYSNF